MAESTPSNQVTNRDVAKGAGTTLLARLGSVIDVIAQPLYVALFGLTGFGLYAALWAAINIIENVADLGMTSALQRTVPQAKTEQEAVASLRAALILGVGPCLVIAVIIWLSAPSLTHIFNAASADQAQLGEAIALFIWALPLWAFVEVMTSALRARRVFGAEIRLRLFWEQIARLGFAVCFWFAGFSTMSLLYAHIASLGVICLLCVRLVARHYDLRLIFSRAPSDGMWDKTLKAGLSILPTNVIARIFGDAPVLALNIVIPGGAGAAAGGLYAISRKISSLVQLVRTAFVYVLAPLASLASTGENEQVRDIYGFATRVSLAVSVPLGAILCASGPAILRFFGEAAAVAIPALAILILARIVEAVVSAAAPIMQVTGRYRDQYVGSVSGLIIAAFLGLYLLPEGGLTGMAAAVAAGLIISAVIPVWQLHRQSRLHPFAPPFSRSMLQAAAIAVIGSVLAAAIYLTPIIVQMPLLVVTLLATVWFSCRCALPLVDRQALGKTGRVLKLYRAVPDNHGSPA